MTGAAPVIVGLGEALFDLLKEGPVLGGAPLNVAVHAHQLGGTGVLAGRIGNDELGARIRRELAARGMSAEHVQIDPERPTGTVGVTFRDGEPQYDIARGVAWDRLEFTPGLESLAGRCAAVCFGSLAQRDPLSRESIGRFLDRARQAVRLFDVNLRQTWYSREILARSLERATIVKLNLSELPRVVDTLELGTSGSVDDQARALRQAYDLQLVVLTRGAEGTVFYTRDGRLQGEPVRYPARPDADSVGAGDACSAGLLTGMIRGWPLDRTLALANRLGAYVASVAGATPRLPEELRTLI